MKQISLAIALFMLIASSGNSNAQSKNYVTLNYTALVSGTMNKNILAEIKVTKANIKAVRDFTRLYKNVSDAKWYTSEKGYSATFDINGKNIKVEYDLAGWRLYSMISYTEKDLDLNIRDLVRRNYYDSNIIGVHQFEFANNKTLYVIKMLDTKSKATTLTVSDGQISDITTGK